MKIRSFIMVMLLLFFSTLLFGEGLGDYFNTYTSVKNNGTSIKISGIKIGNDFYWGKWDLQSNAIFKLSDYGKVDDTKYFNYKKAIESIYNVSSINKSDIESLNLDLDYTNCKSYYKITEDTYTVYYCTGNNYIKFFCSILANDIKLILQNDIFPIYIADGSNYYTKVHFVKYSGNTIIGEFDRDTVISIHKEGNNWINYFIGTYIPSMIIEIKRTEFNSSDYSIISRKELKTSFDNTQ